MPNKAAIWVRVSTDHQHESNQLPAILQFCEHRGWEITKRYELSDVSAYNGAHHEMLKQMLDDAYRGEFEVVVCWAADRVSRGGIEELLKLIRELRERNCSLVSVQEPWLNGSDATTARGEAPGSARDSNAVAARVSPSADAVRELRTRGRGRPRATSRRGPGGRAKSLAELARASSAGYGPFPA
jgi:DNA invertase Pin-like site-specific DNA recombinase